MNKICKLALVFLISLMMLPFWGAAEFQYAFVGADEIAYEYIYVELDEQVIENASYTLDEVKQGIRAIFLATGYQEDELESQNEIQFSRIPQQTFVMTGKEGNGVAQYGFYFYRYNSQYYNPIQLLAQKYESEITNFFVQFPLLKESAMQKEFVFYLGLAANPFYRTDADIRQHDSAQGLYLHGWSLGLEELLSAQEHLINIRMYRLNYDGWYITAIVLGSIFAATIFYVQKKKKQQEKTTDAPLEIN